MEYLSGINQKKMLNKKVSIINSISKYNFLNLKKKKFFFSKDLYDYNKNNYLLFKCRKKILLNNNFNYITNKIINSISKKGKKNYVINKFYKPFFLNLKKRKLNLFFLNLKLFKNLQLGFFLKKIFKSGKKNLIPTPTLYKSKQYLFITKLYLRYNMLYKDKNLKKFILKKFVSDYSNFFKNNKFNLLERIKQHHFKYLKFSRFSLRYLRKKKWN